MADLRDDEEFKIQILKRLDFHSQQLSAYGETVRQVNDLARTVSEVNEQVKENRKFLFGNGESIGIDEQLRNINRIGKIIIGLSVPVVLYVLNYFVDKILRIP